MPDKNNPSLKKLFENASELKQKEQAEKAAEELEKLQKQNEADEKQREEYGNRLYREKIDILKKKQSGNDASEDDKTESGEKHYTFIQKISNFFYHNKWWLGIACFLVLTAGYLIYDAVTTPKYDMTVMLLANDEELYRSIPQIKEFFREYCGDRNNDGNVNAAVFYIPVSEYIRQNQPDIYVASTTQLAALLQTDSPLIVIADTESSEMLDGDKLLLDLKKYYPENENVESSRFYLSKTEFPEIIGYSEKLEMSDSLYIGIRKVSKGASYEKSMRKNFEEDFELLQRIISDLS